MDLLNTDFAPKDNPSGRLGRRALLGSTATLAMLASMPAAPAFAAAVNPYTKTPKATARELHMLRRWCYGFSQESLQDLRNAGSPESWFEAQLTPEAIAESSPMADTAGWWPSINASSDTILLREATAVEAGWHAVENWAKYSLLKRIGSKRQVLEHMTEFWEDHFYIPIFDDGVYPWRAAFGKEMRRLALGSFEELLLASTTHPAMGVSLDNNRSHKNAVNENLGRELLELHTVGQGNYTEDDVKNSAKILTGYFVDTWNTWKVRYEPSMHYTGEINVMEFTHPNTDADGRPAVKAYLSYLARHPATAKRVARKLAVRFVSDTPSTRLVDKLAQVYVDNDTQIKPVLRALIADSEFWSSAGLKVKTPTDETAAMYRALNAQFSRPLQSHSAANTLTWTSGDIGAFPWAHPRPDGPPAKNSSWTNSSRYLASWETHWAAAGGWWPSIGITWLTPAQRLPETSMSLAQFTDHLCRTLLGEEASVLLVEEVGKSLKTDPATIINKNHPVILWLTPVIIALILDSPSFYLR